MRKDIRRTSMQAFVMTELGQGGLANVEDPQPQDGEVLVRPVYAGLCGTDIHLFNEGTMLDPADLPLVLGHEFVGEVAGGDASASASAGLSVGDLVVAEPLVPCGTCEQCLAGRFNLCSDWEHLGITRHGAWADSIAAPVRRLTKVPSGVSARDAALAEPLACAVNFVLDRGRLAPGDTVAILGAGPVGLLCAAVARGAGARTVIVSEPNEGRRKRALLVGADVVLNPLGEDLEAVIERATEGRGADLIVEVTGVGGAMAQAITAARPGSTVVLAGLNSGADVPIKTNAIALKELDIRGGFASRAAMGRALELLADGKLRIDPLVTDEFSWAEAEAAMAKVASDPDTCKILLTAPNHIQK
ncbi:MAG: alcohol dehydrogenase catalytic domain-containing protein [Arthrobacter sp.]|nr:alcohol dehydrogenase catalytic domain-containing protein [Arthrobacter sp.]